jgi:hypothetical protein
MRGYDMVKLAGSHICKSRQFKCQGRQVRKRVQVYVERGVKGWCFISGALWLHIHSDVHCKTGIFCFHIPPFFRFQLNTDLSGLIIKKRNSYAWDKQLQFSSCILMVQRYFYTFRYCHFPFLDITYEVKTKRHTWRTCLSVCYLVWPSKPFFFRIFVCFGTWLPYIKLCSKCELVSLQSVQWQLHFT